MTDETTIRQALYAAGTERGFQAKISKALEIHPSTVKRWIDGGEIPPPMLILLDLYFFGTIPFEIVNEKLLHGVLDFSENQWRAICILAMRNSTTPAKWIAKEIRSYLNYNEEGRSATWEAEHGDSADGTNGK